MNIDDIKFEITKIDNMVGGRIIYAKITTANDIEISIFTQRSLSNKEGIREELCLEFLRKVKSHKEDLQVGETI